MHTNNGSDHSSNGSYFFTNKPTPPSFNHLQIGRLAFYPGSVLFGETVLSSVGQGMLLAAAPPLMHLIVLAAMSALLLMPIFAGIKFLIDNNLSESSLTRRASYTLLYLVDLFLNLKLIVYLGVTSHLRIMNVYSLYAIIGAGIVPAVGLGIAAALVFQSYYAHNTNGAALELEDRAPSPFQLSLS